jgi:general secretion pathway protein K
MTLARKRHPHRRGSVVIIIIWTIAVAALIVSSIQLVSFRQAAFGRESLGRIQARWAARAGMENTISMLGLHTERPIPDDAFAIVLDLEAVSSDELFDSSYEIAHHLEGVDYPGPMDEHSRMNIRRDDVGAFLSILDDITPTEIAEINDWVDADDEPTLLGLERDWYLANLGYEPRNEPFRTVPELEMVAGVWPDVVRGEDFNYNNRLDPNEDDGEFSPPEDEPDGILEYGWGGLLTTYSVDGGATQTGLPRLYLRRAEIDQIVEQCGVDEVQAQALIDFSRSGQPVEQLISTPLSNVAEDGSIQQDPVNQEVSDLTDEQLRAVIAETTTTPPFERPPGRINLNTASSDLIRDLLEVRGFEPAIADEIIFRRNSRREGITSILDLSDIPDLTTEQLQELAGIFTTFSNVYTITSRGRSHTTGLEVEIIAVVDRSTVPVRILEYREQ